MATKEKIILILSSSILWATTSLFSQTLSETITRKVDSLFIEWNRSNSPGCAIGIIKHDSLLYAKGFGMANLEYSIPITPTTTFHMASVSKQFTAYCIILLARQGKIQLNQDIHIYLPWVPDFGTRITVMNLLNHTSGLRDYASLAGLSGLRGSDGIFTQDHALKLLKTQRSLNFTPGAEYSYSNSNFVLLSEIVKAVSGKNLREFADSAIFKPLGMVHTRFVDDYHELISNRAFSYGKIDSNRFANSIENGYTIGDGGLFSDIEDMAKWVKNYYNPAVGDIKDIEQFTEKGKLNNGKRISYASGVMVDKYNGWRTYEHRGDQSASHTYLLVFPDAEMGFLVFSNAGNFESTAAIHSLADLFISDTTRSLVSNVKEMDSNLAIISDTISLKRFVGSYISNNGTLATFKVIDSKFYVNFFGHTDLLIKHNTDTFSIFTEPDIKFCFSKHFDKNGLCNIIAPNIEPDVLKQYKSNIVFTEKLLQNYTGAYYSSELDCKFKIVLIDRHLVLTNGRNFDAKLTLAGMDAMIIDKWWMPHLNVLRNKNHTIQGFELNSFRARHLRFTKVE